VVASLAVSRRQFLLLIIPLVSVLIGFGVLLFVEVTVGGPGVYWDEALERTVLRTVARDFAGTFNEKQQQRAYFRALDAYLKEIDPYAELVPPWDRAHEREMSEGRYGGVGIRIDPGPEGGPIEYLEVTGLKPDGPADQAGIRRLDRIVSVDGASIKELCADGTLVQAQTAIRGELDSKLPLTLMRGEARLEVTVTRAWVDRGSVFGLRMIDEERGIGYVRIEAFQDATARDFRARLKELSARGLRALVLDLRGNRGGMLDRAVDVVDALLSSDDIVCVVSRGSKDIYRATKETAVPPDMPLAVLVDRSSASASEVVAGALQDRRRAVLVGERTYGKFQVQTVRDVRTKLGLGVLKITTAVYLTPNGRYLPRRSRDDDSLGGIQPEVPVPVTDDERRRLDTIFENERLADWNPEQPPVKGDFVDRPLMAAVKLLRGEGVTSRLISDS